jgi:hypothetical protein
MADRPSPLSEEEHNRSFTPAEALLELEPLTRAQAAMLLQNGARTEIIRTSAKSFFCEPKNLPGFTMAEYADIPAYYWAHLSQQSQALGFWDTGLARMWFGTTPYFRVPTAVICTDVRFNREDVKKAKPPIPRQLLAEALEKSAAPAPIATELDNIPEKKLVSNGDLERWAKVFVAVHKDFKGDFALRSAVAMFPDNTVGRDRVAKAISDLIGPRPRGPKKRTT